MRIFYCSPCWVLEDYVLQWLSPWRSHEKAVGNYLLLQVRLPWIASSILLAALLICTMGLFCQNVHFFSMPRGSNIWFPKLRYTLGRKTNICFIWLRLSGLDRLFHNIVNYDPLCLLWRLVSLGKKKKKKQEREKNMRVIHRFQILSGKNQGIQQSQAAQLLPLLLILGDGHWGDASKELY